MADFNLRAIISAVDKLTPTLRQITQSTSRWRRQMNTAGAGGIQMAAGLTAALALPARAFMEAEDASTQLKNTLMTSNGVSAGFEQLSKIAIDLGNKLPGTTADFMAMASQLKALGVSTETLTGGALKATAYLAVVGKPLGVTYESAAEAVGKLGNSFGIAANDLLPFTDTLQRALHMGIKLDEMQYAMARVSGSLKTMGKQGLSVANDMVPLVAMLIKNRVSGEEAGTGLKTMINAAIKAGKFTTIPNLVKDLEKLNKLSPSVKLQKFEKLFGKEHAQKAAIIAAGGYGEMIKQMQQQASLQQRINNSLGTLRNLWEAATGTFTNAMVAFTEAYAPQLKSLADSINNISTNLLDWAKANPKTIKTIIMMAGAFVALKLGFLAAAAGLGVFTALMRTNPFLLLLQGLVIAVPLIYENWDNIIKYFKTSAPSIVEAINNIIPAISRITEDLSIAFEALKPVFNAFQEGLSWAFEIIVPIAKTMIDGLTAVFGAILPVIVPVLEALGTILVAVFDAPTTAINAFVKLVGTLSNIWDALKIAWSAAWDSIKNMIGGAIDRVINKVKSITSLLPSFSNMSVDVNQKAANMQISQKLLQTNRTQVRGGIDVNFANAPPGMRVAPQRQTSPFIITPNVGYRSFAIGAQ